MSAFDTEGELKRDLADYFRMQFREHVDMPFKVESGEIQVADGCRADIIVTIGAERVLAVETKNHGDARPAIGQAALYRGHGIPPAVGVPTRLSDGQRRAVLRSGMWLFEYEGRSVVETRGLGADYWRVLDRWEQRLIDEASFDAQFPGQRTMTGRKAGWKCIALDVVHADRDCDAMETTASAVFLKSRKYNLCEECCPAHLL